MESNILCEREGQTALSGFFEELSVLLQDSDDQEEKERIKDGLRKMTNTTDYLVIGEEGSGKTSLLQAIFSDIFSAGKTMDGDICEYKWGEMELETPVANGMQKKFISSDSMKGISVIDTRGVNRMGKASQEKLEEITGRCSAVFVVLDAGNVKSHKIWDMVESFPKKNLLFFITKCDLVSPEELQKGKETVEAYIRDCGIEAPVFPVSISGGDAGSQIKSMEYARSYIRNCIIGPNPMIAKQRENIREVQAMLSRLRESFLQRRRQYESDAVILQKINTALDSYVANHKGIIANFTKSLAVEINKDIDSYEQEIISKMDPRKIKERFKDKDDFKDYLNMVNDNYKAMMNDSVNRKTIEAMKHCLHDLEIIFQEAVGYFNERENILDLNDRFYGSMSKSRRQIVAETKETALTAGEFYQTLSDASENLFLQIWKEREKYDKKIAMRKSLSIITGGGAGAAAGALGAHALAAIVGSSVTSALGSGTAAAGLAAAGSGLVGTVAMAGLIGIGVIVGAVVINAIAKKMFDPKAAAKMEKNTQECIEQFKGEVDKTRKAMIEQVTGQIMELFEKELNAVDGCFTDFRISVNVESEKIPMLQEKIEKADALAERIRQMERNAGGNES